MFYYLDGEFVPEEEAKVSVLDHGFLYGDGIFEGIKAYNGRVFALDEHVERFFDSARSIMLELPVSPTKLKEAILETLRRNRLRDAYIRPIASRGKGSLGLDPRNCPKATLAILVDAEVRHPEDIEGSPVSEKGINVISTAFRRNGADVLPPRIKSTNYLNNILGKLQANAAGAQDAIFINGQGYVCELTGDNLFLVKKNRILTPPLWIGILDGITRQAVMRVAEKSGFETIEEPLTLHDVYTSDECFCTATRVEVLPIVWVDGREIGTGEPGPVTGKIRNGFLELAGREGTPIYR